MATAWCRINADGDVEYLDWEEIERMAEGHRLLTKGMVINAELSPMQMGVIARLCIAIRESILNSVANTQKIGEK